MTVKDKPADWFAYLSTFLDIEDEVIRQAAVIDWYKNLSPEQQEQVRNYISIILDNMIQLGQALGKIAEQAARVLLEWIETDPEVQAYLAVIEKSKEGSSDGHRPAAAEEVQSLRS